MYKQLVPTGVPHKIRIIDVPKQTIGFKSTNNSWASSNNSDVISNMGVTPGNNNYSTQVQQKTTDTHHKIMCYTHMQISLQNAWILL